MWIGYLTNDGLLPNRSDEGAEPRDERTRFVVAMQAENMTTQKNEYGFPVSPVGSKTAVSVPRVIDFKAWQCRWQQRTIVGHHLFGYIRFDLNVATPQ